MSSERLKLNPDAIIENPEDGFNYIIAQLKTEIETMPEQMRKPAWLLAGATLLGACGAIETQDELCIKLFAIANKAAVENFISITRALKGI